MRHPMGGITGTPADAASDNTSEVIVNDIPFIDEEQHESNRLVCFLQLSRAQRQYQVYRFNNLRDVCISSSNTGYSIKTLDERKSRPSQVDIASKYQ